MAIRAAIFDRDGVLSNFDINTMIAYFKSRLPVNLFDLGKMWNDFGQEKGFPRSLEEEEFFFKNFWEYISDHFNVSPQIREELLKLDYLQFMFAYPEVRDLFLSLRKQGIKIGVLSNFSLASLEASLTKMNLMDLVDTACTAAVLGYSKPQPEAYFAVIDRLNVKPQECLFFDDEQPNIGGAEAIGMKAYLVDRTQSQHDLSKHVVSNLTPVLEILKKHNSS